MITITLSPKEKEMIVIALNMRRNYIETGNALVSGAYAEKFRKDIQIRNLSTDQMQLIIDTENLIKKLYSILMG